MLGCAGIPLAGALALAGFAGSAAEDSRASAPAAFAGDGRAGSAACAPAAPACGFAALPSPSGAADLTASSALLSASSAAGRSERGGIATSGYSMRSWNTPVSTVEKALQILSRSLKVRLELSS